MKTSGKLKTKIRDKLTVAILRGLSLLPLPVNHAVGACIGLLVYLFPSDFKRVTRINIATCFPDKPRLWQQQLVRRNLIETGKGLTEAGYIWWSKPERITQLVKQTTGKELLDSAMAEQKGALYVVPHLGCWEMCGMYVATLYPMSSLYRPSGIESLDEVIRQARQSTGATLVPTDTRGVKLLLKALNEGQCVGILPDQVPQAGTGVFAPLFGVPAYTMVLLTRLAAKHKTPVIFSYAERLPHGQGYHIHFIKAAEGIHDKDQVIAATATNQGVETLIRECPEQYSWSYKRFKRQPEGSRDPYSPQ